MLSVTAIRHAVLAPIRRLSGSFVSLDISPILRDWPYLPDDITVRVIEGEDGTRKIQLRLDLGILQMEFDGRPDGRQIHDADSWLEYHKRRQKDHDAANPDGAPYLLEPEDCAELLREGVQYYHRYVCFWHLGFYELCARDTERNLRLFAFVRGPRPTRSRQAAVRPVAAVRDDDARPGRGHAAGGAGAMGRGGRRVGCRHPRHRAVSGRVQSGRTGAEGRRADVLASLERRNRGQDQSRDGEGPETSEATATLEPQPVDRVAELRAKIELAIVEERYEEAAMFRDELRQLESQTRGDNEGGPAE